MPTHSFNELKMVTGIYGIINLITGKIYIGQAVKFSKRWTNHRSSLRINRHINPYLQSSWNIHGEDNFHFFIIEYCEADVNILNQREDYWMKWHNSANREFGYNQAPAAGSLLGFKASEETRAKLAVRSAKLKGKPRSEEVKSKISATMKGRVFSPETIAKMSDAKKGKKASEETKAKMKIKHFTVEGRERISASSKRRWALRDGSIGIKSKNSV